MAIHGMNNLSLAQVEQELSAGGCFVFYEYCISLIFVTLRRPTEVYFLRANDTGLLRGLPYCLLSLFFGWWGIPWGLIYTPLTIFTNLSGGHDVTAEVWHMLQSSSVNQS